MQEQRIKPLCDNIAYKKNLIPEEQLQREADYVKAQQVLKSMLDCGLISLSEFNKITALNRQSFSPALAQIMPRNRWYYLGSEVICDTDQGGENLKKVTKIDENKSDFIDCSKLRVAAYCRVSTDSDEQLVSLDAQIKHYESYINANPEWEFAGLYYD